MPPLAPPPLVSPVPALRVLVPFRPAPRFAPGGRRVLLLAAAPGAPVLAPCAGRVSFRGRVAAGAPSLTIACLGTGTRVTLSRIEAAAARGATAAAGAPVGQSVGAAIGISVRPAGRAYVDPLPLLASPARREPPSSPARPRPARPRLPEVRLDRPVRTLAVPASQPAAQPAPSADRWLGGVGSALGLSAIGWWLWRRRRRALGAVAPAAVHPAAPRR